jgi:hypothetical protein
VLLLLLHFYTVRHPVFQRPIHTPCYTYVEIMHTAVGNRIYVFPASSAAGYIEQMFMPRSSCSRIMIESNQNNHSRSSSVAIFDGLF